MRIAIALMIVIICFCVGTAISRQKKLRVTQLTLLASMLDEIRLEIGFSAKPVADILSDISERKDFSEFLFLTAVKTEWDNNADFHTAWRIAAFNAEYFSDSDRRLLLSTGEQLGTTDSHGQVLMLEAAARCARTYLDEARNDYKIKGGLSQKTWTLCGIAAGIMLL